VGALAATGLAFITMAAFGMQGAGAATSPVLLGTASTYAVMAGSTITNTGSSVIAGDVGLSPGTSITGFPPGSQSSGVMHITDTAAGTAQGNLTTAYLDAAGRTPTINVSADLGGSTLVPGIYNASSSMALTGTVTLNGGGDANAVFIFQAGSTLTTATNSSVVLENGAQACNVFWQVGSSATLNTTTSFVGTIIALTSITLDTDTSVSGRVLARNGAVTLDDNAITVPTCSASGGTTTSTTSITSTTSTTPVSTTTTPVSTTTTPVSTTTTPVSTTTGPVTATTTPPIPLGSPATGAGGSATSPSSPLLALGFGLLGLAGVMGGLKMRARRVR
jgi:Ice-binding-like